jgi:site-specific DNA-methyltransferase (adenine-specific)
MMAYLTYMAQRIVEMHRILKDTGSLYLHCDPTASHYLKVVLDEIFGKDNFRNEIVWCYRGAGYPKNDFGRRHDIIFRYSKSQIYTFNLDAVREEYAEATKERFAHYIGNKRKGRDFGQQALNPLGKQPDDWWQIQPIAPSSKERTGYPTQKPLALLHKIIKASSNEGDIVMDPFCGCATTCVAAQQLDRKWIGIDIEKQARSILIDRLSDDAGLFKDFVSTEKVPQRTDVQTIEPTKSVKERLYEEQNGICNGCKVEFSIRNMEIDHIIPKSKGGGDYYENYQLLCSACNRKKGDRPMEYLRDEIERSEAFLKNKIIFGE